MSPSGSPVRPPELSDPPEYEIEPAVIIGKRGRHLTLENAMEHVAGYTVAIELSARDWQRHPKQQDPVGNVAVRQEPQGD
jgi:2-keto-4-pentenoate hydratase/2-oxohepta-3-ene-1,7-dioic acid hydratase in catechol pathway